MLEMKPRYLNSQGKGKKVLGIRFPDQEHIHACVFAKRCPTQQQFKTTGPPSDQQLLFFRIVQAEYFTHPNI